MGVTQKALLALLGSAEGGRQEGTPPAWDCLAGWLSGLGWTAGCCRPQVMHWGGSKGRSALEECSVPLCLSVAALRNLLSALVHISLLPQLPSVELMEYSLSELTIKYIHLKSNFHE